MCLGFFFLLLFFSFFWSLTLQKLKMVEVMASGKTSFQCGAAQVSFSFLTCLSKYFNTPRNRGKGWGWKAVFKLDLNNLLRGTFLRIDTLPAIGWIPIPFSPWRFIRPKHFTKSQAFWKQQFSVLFSLASDQTAIDLGFIPIKNEIYKVIKKYRKHKNTYYLNTISSVFELLGHGRTTDSSLILNVFQHIIRPLLSCLSSR